MRSASSRIDRRRPASARASRTPATTHTSAYAMSRREIIVRVVSHACRDTHGSDRMLESYNRRPLHAPSTPRSTRSQTPPPRLRLRNWLVVRPGTFRGATPWDDGLTFARRRRTRGHDLGPAVRRRGDTIIRERKMALLLIRLR